MIFTVTDPTAVADTISDTANSWYESAGIWALVLAGLVFLLWLAGAIAISKKAGYSGWWGALFVLVPFVSIILFALLALLKWPVIKERNEALGVLKENNLTLPRHERAAVKEAERKLAVEAEAKRNMEKAQAERIKADQEKARFASKSPAPAAAATTTADAPVVEASEADKPVEKKPSTDTK